MAKTKTGDVNERLDGVRKRGMRALAGLRNDPSPAAVQELRDSGRAIDAECARVERGDAGDPRGEAEAVGGRLALETRGPLRRRGRALRVATRPRCGSGRSGGSGFRAGPLVTQAVTCGPPRARKWGWRIRQPLGLPHRPGQD